MDAEAKKQLRETSATLDRQLKHAPDDLTALVMADVVRELDPKAAVLRPHVERFHRTRDADWRVRARDRGVHRLLFHLAHGWRNAKIGGTACEVLERWAIEISEARDPDVAPGVIDGSLIPAGFLDLPYTRLTFHPDGHLRRAAVKRDSLHVGELVLDVTPGRGRYSITQKLGGYGTHTAESYADGKLCGTLNTPWHDGEDWSESMPWTKWVLSRLDELTRLARGR